MFIISRNESLSTRVAQLSLAVANLSLRRYAFDDDLLTTKTAKL